MKSSVLESITWQGNSRKMYRAVMEVVPGLFKSKIRHMVEEWLIENKVTVVTEELVVRMFNEKAPKPFIQKLTPVLNSLKTK